MTKWCCRNQSEKDVIFVRIVRCKQLVFSPGDFDFKLKIRLHLLTIECVPMISIIFYSTFYATEGAILYIFYSIVCVFKYMYRDWFLCDFYSLYLYNFASQNNFWAWYIKNEITFYCWYRYNTFLQL